MDYCPGCNAEVSIEARFCRKCGYKLPSFNSHAPQSRQSQQFLRPFLPSKTLRQSTRDIAEQQTQQEPAYRIGQQRSALPESQSLPEQFVQRTIPQARQAPSVEDLPTKEYPIEVVKGRPPLVDTPGDFEKFEDYFESYVATSKAAEQWRTSWRNRQRSKAGPATTVTRGQSPVPEPLMAMQYSLARMRAIITPDQKQNKPNASFWITIFIMVCLIAGLGAYIASTYYPY